jgi:serine/threonine protein kinase
LIDASSTVAGQLVECPNCHAPSTVPHSSFSPGSYWNNLQIQKDLPGSELKRSLLALQFPMERHVVLDILREEYRGDSELTEFFLEPARLVARVNSPNVVQVYKAAVDGDIPYMVCEFVDGDSFANIIHGAGRLIPERAISIASGAVKGLRDLYVNEGLVYQVLAADDIFVSRDGEVKLAVPPILSEVAGHECEPYIAGEFNDARFLAPELLRQGVARFASDVYSMGVVLYYALTGVHPFEGSTGQEIALLQATEMPKPPMEAVGGIPENISNLVMNMLIKNPDQRIQEPEELLRLLEIASAGEDIPLNAEGGVGSAQNQDSDSKKLKFAGTTSQRLANSKRLHSEAASGRASKSKRSSAASAKRRRGGSSASSKSKNRSGSSRSGNDRRRSTDRNSSSGSGKGRRLKRK